MPDSLETALAVIDAANAGDPSSVSAGGVEVPVALAEGVSAHRWVLRLHPDAPDALQIAARGHHLRRWMTPRDAYPHTRAGYLAWRTQLYEFHAQEVADVMSRAGYSPAAIAEAGRLLRKQDLKVDADAQTYEDAVSLAFLEVRLSQFAPTVSEEQLMRALRRTWRKMSAAGRDAALTIDLASGAAEAVHRALAE